MSEQLDLDLLKQTDYLHKAAVNYEEAVLLCAYYSQKPFATARDIERCRTWEKIKREIGASLTADTQHNLF